MYKKIIFCLIIIWPFLLKANIAVLEPSHQKMSFDSEVFGSCVVEGSAECRILKAVHCESNGCIPYWKGSPRRGAPSGEFHVRSTSETVAYSSSTDVKLVIITGAQATSLGFDWLINNANQLSIRVANFSFHTPYTNAELDNLLQKKVIPVVSAGNGGLNGLAVKNHYDLNIGAKNNRVISVGAGPTSRGNNNPDCDSLSEVRHIDLLCSSNAIDPLNSAHSDYDYFVMHGCLKGAQVSDGLSCGTSFAAPRLAAIVGSLLHKYPLLTRDQVVEALNNSSNKVYKGVLGREYKSAELSGAIAFVENNIDTTPSLSANFLATIKSTAIPPYIVFNNTSEANNAVINKVEWTSKGRLLSTNMSGFGAYHTELTGDQITLTIFDTALAISDSITVNLNIPLQCDPHCPITRITGDRDPSVDTEVEVITTTFEYCIGEMPKYDISWEAIGDISLYELDVKYGGFNWNSLHIGVTNSVIKPLNEDDNVSLRVRGYGIKGWSEYKYLNFRSKSCPPAGGSWVF